jgi:hypothetical protein
MKRALIAVTASIALTALLAGCSERVDDSEGGVILRVTDFNGLPARVSVNLAGDAVTIDSIQIDNIPKDPNGGTSALMDVEMDTYEVRFSRTDTGTRVPPPLLERVFGLVPVNGATTYENLPIMRATQFNNPPLSDLLVSGGGIDTETGSQVISLEITMRFFGETITGDDVATAPIRFVVEFVP